MAKEQYAIFRSSHLNFVLGYLREIEGPAVLFTKMSDRNDLRKALVSLFVGLGDSEEEAMRTTEVYLQQALHDAMKMDELLDMLNAQIDVSNRDPLVELHVYILKQANSLKNPEPSFEAVVQQI